MKRLYFVFYGTAMALLITALVPQSINAQIIADGNEHTVDAIGTTTDIGMPLNDEIAFITFRLVGGDGGYAQVLDHIGGKVVKANGGSGAFVTATFPVGNGPNEIPPGSIFRFMEGRSGQNGSSDATAGAGFDYGGGGGGSGILYKGSSTSPYKLLAVAGGGGGAYQGMFGGSSVDHEPGQSGRVGTSGGSGNGSDWSNAGGMGGHDGGDQSVGDGGGARTETSSLRTSAYTHEDCDDCEAFPGYGVSAVWRAGGTGYGCGGHGLGSLVIGSGGGGGGYSGGGFGGIYGRGGGGGSYVNPRASAYSFSDQGTDPTPDHGWITYQVTLNQRPVAKCKTATIYLDGNGLATLYPSDVDNGSSDPDGSIASRSLSKTSFDCDDTGPNQVTLTVTDNMGSTATCTATVNIMDARAPNAICRDITVQLNAAGVATIDGADVDDGSSDNCSITSMTVAPNTFDCSNTSTPVTVTLTETDGSGNQSSCNAIVTVEDNVPPVAMCKDMTVELDAAGNASISGTDIDNGSSDACGIADLSVSPSTFTCAEVGPNTVTLAVTDVNGNFSTCTSMVRVEDNVPPVAVCQNITVYLDANGDASITADNVDGGSTDNCSIDSKSIDVSAFTCANVGTPVTVTLTVTDPSGNDDECEAMVTVLDTVLPVALCKNITIQLDGVGQASIDATDIENGSTDACGIASYVASKKDFTCADLGNNTVTLTVTDVNGNSVTCDAIITVEDNFIPAVRSRNVTIVLDKQGEGYVTPQMIDNGSTDNCTIVDIWLEGETDYDCGDTGEHEVVLKVEDQSGNIGSYNAFVTVKFFEPDFSNNRSVANGDTIHRVACQAPWDISFNDLDDYNTIIQHGSLTTHVYKENLPENAPWGMYSLWRYEYVVKDACYHTYTFNYYTALYDLAPPNYQNFPNDTVVAKSADVPPVDTEVKIIDVCQYVVWDTVMTTPVLHTESGDTLGFTRRWMARDPSGHESFKDQMIWVGSGDRNQYSLITGRIADEEHIANARFAGEAGTNGLPVSLYRLDTDAGTRIRVSSWTTGDWMGSQGTYYFAPENPGMYQVKIDTTICLVDTLKFNKWLWSDTLAVAAGASLNQGWIISQECVDLEPTGAIEAEVVEVVADPDQLIQNQSSSDKEWLVYPNPTNSYLRLNIYTDHQLYYRIYDALGRSVKTGIYQQGQTIDVRGLNSGLYHLQLRDEKELLGTKRVLLME